MSTKPWGALPIQRIHTIMKSSSDVENIGRETTLMMAKAAELFIKKLSREAYALTDSFKKLDYKHVAEVVNRDEKYEFLKEIMPRKITYAEYKRLQGITGNEEASTEDDDSETGDSDSETQ